MKVHDSASPFFHACAATCDLGLHVAPWSPGRTPWSVTGSEERRMNPRRMLGVVLVAGLCLAGQGRAMAQCCLSELFAGCFSCCRPQPQLYAVAPVAAPVMAPVVAPVPAPPPPVMVPMQQTSFVPETTYRTEYRCVPVTTYKPSCEIDPCTGCSVGCMQQVTEYVQQPVNVPVTQYRRVTTTQYIQMQPGYAAPPAQGYPAVAPGMAPAAGPAASPFSGVQAAPQAWGAAGPDVVPQPAPAYAPPALPPGTQPSPAITPGNTYTYYPQSAPPMQPIAPQSGTYQPGTYAPPGTTMPNYAAPSYTTPSYAVPGSIAPQPQAQPQQQPQLQQLQSIAPPALSPAPSLRPIPELPRNGRIDTSGSAPAATGTSGSGVPNGAPAWPGDGNSHTPVAPAPAAQPGMPVVPGNGPGPATGAFPRLLEPTSHTTSWGPSDGGAGRVHYPTAALPSRRQGQ